MLETNSNSALICSLCFQLLEKVKKKYIKFKLLPNQDTFVSSSFAVSTVNLASVELSGEIARYSSYLIMERA